MIDTGGLRRGITLDMNGELVKVTDFQHVKQGRGSAFVRMTMRNLRTGSTTQDTFNAGTKFQTARLERHHVQFLYQDGDDFNFMDIDNFDQFSLPREALADAVSYMKENDTIDLLTYQGAPVDVELPVTVNLKVTQTDPGYKGDTATGGSKPATVESGLTITVPLFINEDDIVKIDTRTGEYLERVT
ncbi:MAG: elongation factor P [Thermomicrobiaceae bacterium]